MQEANRPQPQFAVCIDNTGYPASLERYKIYRALPDEEAARDGDICTVGESGEAYLYLAPCFVTIEVPQAAERATLHANCMLLIGCVMVSNCHGYTRNRTYGASHGSMTERSSVTSSTSFATA